MIFYKLPLEVKIDVSKRVGDWLSSGGNEDDPYIYQQLHFIEQVIRKVELHEVTK
ncbi:MAG TPA: hypothetical protein VK094_00130 [Pseudogracilibacillus sp.]|nr:hypothetical protein [Pseudogracilibacillus sp.]